jgi:hypothetical protein
MIALLNALRASTYASWQAIRAALLASRQSLAASRWLLASLLLLLMLGFSVAAPTPALCAGNCQGCYCDQIINGVCYVNGRPSACIGCVGASVSPRTSASAAPGWAAVGP